MMRRDAATGVARPCSRIAVCFPWSQERRQQMSKLTDLLGIEFAIIQAPMAGAQDSAMAIAVSNAGGLGSVPCAMLNAQGLRKELDTLKAHTSKPFNVNFFCH